MSTKVSVTVNGTKEQVWQVITDIENSVNVISGIEKIEVLEQPEQGLVGFKWRETRTLFGKTATEVMWITDVEPGTAYDVRAESHGAIYLSRMEVTEEGGTVTLSMEHSTQLQTFGAKLMNFFMGWMFANATRDALQQDLEDIKAAVEGV